MATGQTPLEILNAAMAASGVAVLQPDGSVTPAAAPAAPAPPVAPQPAAAPAAAPAAPAAPGSEPASLTPDQLAAMAAANAAPVAPAPPAPAAAPAELVDPVKADLIAKLGSAAGELVWNQIQGTATLHQRMGLLLDAQSRPPAPAPVTFDPLQDPTVKFHSDQIAQIDADLKEVDTQIQDAVARATKANTAMANGLAQQAAFREAGLTERVDALEREIRAARSEYDSARTDWKSAVAELKGLNRQKSEKSFLLQQATANAQAAHQATISENEERNADQAVWNAKQKSDFDSAVATHARAYGIQVTPALRETLVDRFDRFVQNLPPTHSKNAVIDFNWFVGAALDEQAKTWGLTRKPEFTQHARDAAAAAIAQLAPPPPQPAGAAPAVPSAFDQLSPAQQVEAARLHARRTLGVQ